MTMTLDKMIAMLTVLRDSDPAAAEQPLELRIDNKSQTASKIYKNIKICAPLLLTVDDSDKQMCLLLLADQVS